MQTIAYACPHDLEVYDQNQGEGSIEALVRHARAVGPTVRLELRRKDNGSLIEAEMTKDRYQELQVKSGDKVFIGLRNFKVFVEDYQI